VLKEKVSIQMQQQWIGRRSLPSSLQMKRNGQPISIRRVDMDQQAE